MWYLLYFWRGRRPKVRHTGCQPCLRDGVPIKTLDMRAGELPWLTVLCAYCYTSLLREVNLSMTPLGENN